MTAEHALPKNPTSFPPSISACSTVPVSFSKPRGQAMKNFDRQSSTYTINQMWLYSRHKILVKAKSRAIRDFNQHEPTVKMLKSKLIGTTLTASSFDCFGYRQRKQQISWLLNAGYAFTAVSHAQGEI